jgi:diguanylate cyclase (GGDEF)-like protein/PAS domain S-box-containing protein
MSEPEGPEIFAAMQAAWTTSQDANDALERKLAEQRLHSEQLQLLNSAVRLGPQGVAILTPAVEVVGPRISFVNDSFCSIYGRQREDIIGNTVLALGIVDRQRPLLDSLLQHIFDRKPFDAEATALRESGSEMEIELQVLPVENSGQVTHWVAFVRDVTDTKNQVVKLRHQAMHDSLTDLPNRMMLFDRLESALQRSRSHQMPLALLLMDLDRFKEVNDTFGHHFGDMLLKQVAFRLSNQLSPADTVARLGGDEFAMVLVNAADSNAVAATARRLLNTLQQPFVVDGQVLEVGASIGVAIAPDHGNDARTLLRRADVAMYAAKHSQTGYTFHQHDLEPRSGEQLSLVVEMRHAIERNEFELYFQPKLHLRSGLITRVEVLVRWNHPVRGLLTPVVFIPVAERTGLIKPLTDWILDRALQQCREWQDVGVPLHIAVNVSAKSLQEQTLPAKVNALLSKWDIDPRFLKIEITESSIMADPAHALAILSMLQSMGVRLSVDDFGTGYSSLTHLRELPVDEIKIDKSFVMGMGNSEADAAIVRTVIDLAHNLGKQVCAEGVETERAWWRLREMGCDLAQGYWISKPLNAAGIVTWLVETSWGLALGQKTPSH